MSGEEHSKEPTFRPKDLVELWQPEEEKELRNGLPLFGLVLRVATVEECEEHSLLSGRRKNWTFYKVIVEDEYHFVAEQFMTLAQRNDGTPVHARRGTGVQPSRATGKSGTYQKRADDC